MQNYCSSRMIYLGNSQLISGGIFPPFRLRVGTYLYFFCKLVIIIY